MKFLTGDDNGILKLIRVEAKKVDHFGPKVLRDAAERLCWAGPEADRESRVAIARASGLLELRDSTGRVLATQQAAPGIRGLQVLGSGLLGVSADGSATVVERWCGDEVPEQQEEAAEASDGAGEGKQPEPTFKVPGPVAAAKLDPCGPQRLIFGGGENDVKLYDLESSKVIWCAKNVPNSHLQLRVPVKVSALEWGTPVAPSRGMVLCGTTDGKIRLYDHRAQRRPLLELVIGFGAGAGTAGYTGTTDDLPRPITCSAVAQVRSSDWGFFAGNTLGILREYDLRNLPTIPPAKSVAGRKPHLKWAAQQMPFRSGYRGVMGSIRGIDVHPNGDFLVAVGLGRFAYVFETRRTRTMHSKVYLKQKLCCVLFSSEAKTAEKGKEGEGSEEEGEEEDQEAGADGGGSDDEVLEGFSDDEVDAEPAADADSDAPTGAEADSDAGDSSDSEGDEEPQPKRARRKKAAAKPARRKRARTAA